MQTTDHACRDFHLKLLDDGRLPNTHLQEMTHDNVKFVFIFQTKILYKYLKI